jgi:hypothetical protein
MITGTADPYRAFLDSADVTMWARCLEEARSLVDEAGAGDEGEVELAQALTIAAYVEWLGRLSGDLESEGLGQRRHGELRRALDDRSRGAAPSRFSRCWAIELAWNGYSALATEQLEEGGPMSPELQLLVLPNNEVRQVALLRPLFSGPEPCRFLPAVHVYGAALVGIGAMHRARELVLSGDWDTADPMVLDIIGTTSERLGEWPQALEAYEASTWPIHRYRAAMIAAISGSPAQASDLVLDEPTRRLIGEFGSELDQAELIRCIGFINACLWNPVDDWVVARELGNLAFRRRRFAEAEFHLSHALRVAPQRVAFPLAQLRFTNLTWLTRTGPGAGQDVGSALDMTPEAIQAGCAAIDCAGPDDDTANIRTWIAGETLDFTYIPPSLDAWSPSDRAVVYSTTDHPTRAIDAWIEALGTTYSHRVVRALLVELRDAGFRSTAAHLGELVLQSSYDDFAALWETADAVAKLASLDDEEADETPTLTDRYARRLLELSELEFKNTVRSFGFFADVGLADLAEELLVHATRLAEGVSELLAVAVLRRTTRGSRIGRIDREGLRCLARAVTEARDRLERLEIAREHFYYGRTRAGRDLLESEGVFGDDSSLTPVELVVVLQCGPWLSRDERARLAHAAAAQLNFDHRTGAQGAYPATYGERLLAAVAEVDPLLEAEIRNELAPPLVEFTPNATWGGAEDDPWPAVPDQIEELLNDARDDAGLAALVEEASRSPSFGFRLVLIAHLLEVLHDLTEEAQSVQPSVLPEDTPISKSDPRVGSPRTIELCDLWRARLTDPEKAPEAAGALQAFFAAEAEIQERWEGERRQAGAPIWQRIEQVLDVLQDALTVLVTEENRAEVNPVLAALYGSVAVDVDELLRDLAEQRRRAAAELAQVGDLAEGQVVR